MKTKFSGILTLLLVFMVQLSFSQEKIISGTVSDLNGNPLPGATVLVKGTSSGVSTGFDGNYSIKANQGDVLVFSFIGFITAEITAGASTTINISLNEDATSLDEVVVVAYGSQTKKSIVGSVGIVSDEVLENTQATSPLGALEGTVPGVSLITSGGQPGTNPTIRIRGFGSLNASQDPLIVVDGAAYNGNINLISQEQIESITVLKDAASSALYGSRAANGVILITTKKGNKNAAPKITFRSQIGVSNPSVGLHDVVGAEDYMKLTWEALRNTNQYEYGQTVGDAAQNASNQLVDYLGYNPYSVSNPIDNTGNVVSGANLLWDTDWEDLLLQSDGIRTNQNFTLSGGSDKTTYFASLDYLNEEGAVIDSNFERYASRLNLESQVKDWLKIGLNTSFSHSDSNIPDQNSGSTEQITSFIYGVSGVFPVYIRDENGALILDGAGNKTYDTGDGVILGQPVNSVRTALGGTNVLASIKLGQITNKQTNFLGNIFADFKIIEGLSFRTSFSYENYLSDNYTFYDDQVGFSSGYQGSIGQSRNITTTTNAIQSLKYVKDFGDHNVGADLIYEAYTYKYDWLSASGQGFLPGVEVLAGATTPSGASGNTETERLNSYLARVSYNYDKKYFAEFSARRDGSSRFSQEARWGNFFAAGGSWIVSEESFLMDSKTISYLKLKASYGELGNNRGIGLFPYQSVYSLGYSNEGNTGVLLSGVADPLISWEKTATTNVGVDFGFFKGVISGSIEWFNKESIDLIYAQPLPASTGVTSITTNVGALKNYGWEFGLQATIFNKDDFTWTAGLNFSMIENEILELTQDEFISGVNLWKPGNSIYDFYIRDWAGVDPADGYGMWFMDVLDNDGEVIDKVTTKDYSEATNYENGSAIPKIQGGFTSSLTYKQFDLNILTSFSFGAKLLDYDYARLTNRFQSSGASASPGNLDRWQNVGDITNTPLLLASTNNHSSTSTRFLYDNDYIRLKSLTFGYNFPNSVLDKTGLSKLRLFLQGDNLLTWQSHEGIDPEQSFSGTASGGSPLSKTTSLGVIIEF